MTKPSPNTARRTFKTSSGRMSVHVELEGHCGDDTIVEPFEMEEMGRWLQNEGRALLENATLRTEAKRALEAAGLKPTITATPAQSEPLLLPRRAPPSGRARGRRS